MAYIGVQPADAYTSFAVQHFTTSATDTFTLDYPVANENEIALFINNVRQEPGSSYAYTASGTTLTLSSAITGSDSMYAVFIGKAVQTVTPAVGSVTNDMLSGSIATSKLANQNIGFRNLIINGDMSIAQRGTSGTGSSYGSVDRIYVTRDATSATQSQETLSSSDSPYSLGFRNYFRITNTGTTSATSAYISINQKIEAQNLAKSGWEYTSSSSAITVSFWARSSLAGTYYANARTDDGTTYNYTFDITLSANTWTKITKTIYGNSNLTINNDNGNGLALTIWAYLGTDYTTSGHTSNQWNIYSSTDQTPDFSQNWRNTASATFDITGLQLEVGTTASDFEFLPYDVNLNRCYRYYYRKISEDAYGPLTQGMQIGASNCMTQGYHPVVMRSAPSIAIGGNWTCEHGTTGNAYAISGTRRSRWAWSNEQSISATDGSAAIVYSNNNTASYFEGDAEL